jgi:phospholipid/cholesterol/gamma-HCH transport system ATP-binding protein
MEAQSNEARSNEAQPNTPPPILVRSLRKSFGQQRVLNGISLSIAPHEIVTVLGRSGTGKSVLLKLLIGLEKPDAGSISIEGHEIESLKNIDQLNEIRKRVGFLFQQAALYDSLTIRQNVAFPLKRNSPLSDEEQKSRVEELLSSVGMDRDQDKMPSEISGGMKKRVGLARALALDPEIVMFDEPTAGLDPITAAEIASLIVELREKRHITSLVVTHDIHTARAISDRLVVLNEGNILMEGTFEDLQKSKEPFVAQFLKDAR